MGRADPAPRPPRRGRGSPAGWILAGVLAIALAALLASQIGKLSRVESPAIGGPIEAKGRVELVDVLECAACYEDSYRYEARLWWGSSDGRME